MNLAKRYLQSIVFGCLTGLLCPVYVYYVCFKVEDWRKHVVVNQAIAQAYSAEEK